MTEKEDIVKECMLASCEGPFFRDAGADDPWWEFHTLFGLTHSELSLKAESFPDCEISNEIIMSIFGNLLGYPHGHIDDDVWQKHISVTAEQLSVVAKQFKIEIEESTEQ